MGETLTTKGGARRVRTAAASDIDGDNVALAKPSNAAAKTAEFLVVVRDEDVGESGYEPPRETRRRICATVASAAAAAGRGASHMARTEDTT